MLNCLETKPYYLLGTCYPRACDICNKPNCRTSREREYDDMQTSPKWLFDYLFVIRRNRAFFPGRIFPAVANSWDTLKTISQTVAGNKKKAHYSPQTTTLRRLQTIFHRVYGGGQLVNKWLTGSMQWPVLVWSPYEKWENTVAQTWSKIMKKSFKNNFKMEKEFYCRRKRFKE